MTSQHDLSAAHHVLYRMYDQHETLLYAGITMNIGARMAGHRGDKPWWHLIAHITLEHHATRTDAEDAKREAILTEQPLYNLLRVARRRSRRDEARHAAPLHLEPGGYQKHLARMTERRSPASP